MHEISAQKKLPFMVLSCGDIPSRGSGSLLPISSDCLLAKTLTMTRNYAPSTQKSLRRNVIFPTGDNQRQMMLHLLLWG